MALLKGDWRLAHWLTINNLRELKGLVNSLYISDYCETLTLLLTAELLTLLSAFMPLFSWVSSYHSCSSFFFSFTGSSSSASSLNLVFWGFTIDSLLLVYIVFLGSKTRACSRLALSVFCVLFQWYPRPPGPPGLKRESSLLGKVEIFFNFNYSAVSSMFLKIPCSVFYSY